MLKFSINKTFVHNMFPFRKSVIIFLSCSNCAIKFVCVVITLLWLKLFFCNILRIICHTGFWIQMGSAAFHKQGKQLVKYQHLGISPLSSSSYCSQLLYRIAALNISRIICGDPFFIDKASGQMFSSKLSQNVQEYCFLKNMSAPASRNTVMSYNTRKLSNDTTESQKEKRSVLMLIFSTVSQKSGD